MNIIATICNYRPDLTAIQLDLCRRFCVDEFMFVVGTQSKDRKLINTMSIGIELVELAQGSYADGFSDLVKRLPVAGSNNVLFIEEDVFPTSNFTIQECEPAARYFGSGPALTMRRWSGDYPDVWPNVIPSYRALEAGHLPKHWPQYIRDMYEHEEGKLGCEIIDGYWLHLDKSSGAYQKWFMQAKDKIVRTLAEHYGASVPAKSFARWERKRTQQEIDRHNEAVKVAYAGNMPEVQAGCKGCG